MATNPYLQKEAQMVESEFIGSIIAESIQWGGMDFLYIPRSLNNVDRLYGEDTLSSFDAAIPIEMYLENVQGWDGEGALIARFGLEMRSSATLVLSRKRWLESVRDSLPNTRDQKLVNKPLEGDLIYEPVTKALLEIRFVDGEDPFFQTGVNFVWKLSVEKFQYNSEQFNTGDEFLDEKFGQSYSDDRLESGLQLEDGSGKVILESGGYFLRETYDTEEVSQEVLTYGENNTIKEEFTQIQDFSTDNPFGDEF